MCKNGKNKAKKWVAVGTKNKDAVTMPEFT